MIEFFAGNGNLSRCMKLSGIQTGKLDILYPGSQKQRKYKTNVMDVNSCSGFALAGCILSVSCMELYSYSGNHAGMKHNSFGSKRPWALNFIVLHLNWVTRVGSMEAGCVWTSQAEKKSYIQFWMKMFDRILLYNMLRWQSKNGLVSEIQGIAF